MAVATAATLLRSPLVQVNDLDPSAQLVYTAQSVGDVSGGLHTVTCTCPTDLAWFVSSVGCEMDGSNTSVAQFRMTVAGVTVFRRGAPANAMDTVNAPDFGDPPRLLLSGQPLTLVIRSVNVDGDDLFIGAIAFGWELQVARNIPQKWFWPGTLA